MIFSFIRKLTLTVFLVTLGTNCMASSESENNYTQFDVGKAGAIASTDVHVSWMTKKYPRIVALMIRIRKGWKDEHGNDLTLKYNQLLESLTGLKVIPSPPDNALPKEHKGINLHITWIERKTGKILKERDVYRDKGHGWIRSGYGTSFDLDGISLPSGNYRVIVKALHDDQRFDGTFETGICVGYLQMKYFSPVLVPRFDRAGEP